MQLQLTFSKKELDVLEKRVLRMLIRDYYLYYSKLEKFKPGSGYWELSFYCRPDQEGSITYALGCYSQALIGWHKKSELENSNHIVPRGFPNCLLLEPYKADY